MITVLNNNEDLGLIKKGITTKFVVNIVNTSNEVLDLTLSPYCSSCTTGKLLKNKLAPQEIGVIELKFTPTGVGNQTKIVGIKDKKNG
jgi:hypothetical protein